MTPDLGTVIDGHTVRFERVFPLPIDRLWDYLTTPELLSRWLTDGQIGPERAVLRFADSGSSIEGAVVVWDPPHVVEFDWDGGFTQPDGSRVRFELTAQDADTRLVPTHTRIVAPAAAEFAAGWHRHLDTLTALAGGTQPAADRLTWAQLRQQYQTV